MKISHLREEYTQAGLNRKSLADTPIEQFNLWFVQAQKANIAEPNAMSLATVSSSGFPSLRTVLLKYFNRKGFVFFTNYRSTKALDIAVNPHVALLFPWVILERQVIIRGIVEKISTKESSDYFKARPHGSQLGAWASQQSTVVASRTLLEMKLIEMEKKFSLDQVPPPPFWGGYCVFPQQIEFWQGRPNRLHDRFLYSRIDDNNKPDAWRIERLSP